MEGTKVVVEVDSSSDVSRLLELLNKNKLVTNVDFTFMYEPKTYGDNYTTMTPRRVTFFFKEGKHATWFSLIH